MSLTIEHQEIESLLAEIVEITGESPLEALRIALVERRNKLVAKQEKTQNFHAFLENEIWPQIPPELLGTELTKEEEAHILGYDI